MLKAINESVECNSKDLSKVGESTPIQSTHSQYSPWSSPAIPIHVEPRIEEEVDIINQWTPPQSGHNTKESFSDNMPNNAMYISSDEEEITSVQHIYTQVQIHEPRIASPHKETPRVDHTVIDTSIRIANSVKSTIVGGKTKRKSAFEYLLEIASEELRRIDAATALLLLAVVSTDNLNEENKEIVEHGLIKIGTNGTVIHSTFLQGLDWTIPVNAARKIIVEVFGLEVLATHTLTGKRKRSKHGNKPQKSKLDSKKVADITELISCNSSYKARDIKRTIQSKCTEANKLMRKKMGKK